jgi:hypothetical protein
VPAAVGVASWGFAVWRLAGSKGQRLQIKPDCQSNPPRQKKAKFSANYLKKRVTKMLRLHV